MMNYSKSLEFRYIREECSELAGCQYITASSGRNPAGLPLVNKS